MTSGRAIRLALIFIVSNVLFGCGTVVLPVYTSPLIGNWNIAGNSALGQYPLLSLAVFVNGNQITASGFVAVQCTNQGGGVGSTISLAGTIATDGSFQLAEPSSPLPGGTQVVVSGTVPAQGATTWSGSYSIIDASSTNCVFSQTAPFTAAALAPFDGTYAGPATFSPNAPGNVSFSIVVSQGAVATAQHLSGPVSYLPLTATITVSGSPCFTHGSTAVNTFGADEIQGDFSFINFAMDDGSLVLFNGMFASPDESAINPAEFSVSGGKCNQETFNATLTRQ